MIVIVKAVQTCMACPSSWDAWDSDGCYWYLRFRHGHGTMRRNPELYFGNELSFETGGELDGVISLDDFCQAIGVTLSPDVQLVSLEDGWDAYNI